MSTLTVLVMAAGEGTRMRSSLPKPLHPVCGRAMIAWPVIAAREAGATRVAVIVSPDRDISAALPDGTETVVQEVADGTGGAVRAARELVEDADELVVLSGDHPLVTGELIAGLLETHRAEGAAATLMTARLEDPAAYGRILRGPGGEVTEIVETRDPAAVPPEVLAITEVNTGTYAFDAAPLAEALGRIGNDNPQGEHYLGDVLPILRGRGLRIAGYAAPDARVNLGVNTRAELAVAEREARRSILERHMLAGVTVVDPGSTWIDAGVEIEPDVRIEPGTSIRGESRIGAGSVVGPHTTLIDSSLGREVSVPHSYLVSCDVDDRCSVGPFAYLRPGAELRAGAKAGTFVEIKNARIGEGAKVPHLSYVGDAEVGAAANLGAGTITANYDGFEKHRTKIGEGARIGVHNALVAPIDVGDRAYTGAGAVIRKPVPPGALGVTRAEQRNFEGYADRRAEEAKREEEDQGS